MSIRTRITAEIIMGQLQFAQAEYRGKIDILVETINGYFPGFQESYRYNLCKTLSKNLHRDLQSTQAKENLQMFTIISQKLQQLKEEAESDDMLQAFIEGKKEAKEAEKDEN